MDSGKCSLLILLDNSAAYDTINHVILEKKLTNMGIQGQALGMVNNFISDRKFKFSIGKKTSMEKRIRTGIPKG